MDLFCLLSSDVFITAIFCGHTKHESCKDARFCVVTVLICFHIDRNARQMQPNNYNHLH